MHRNRTLATAVCKKERETYFWSLAVGWMVIFCTDCVFSGDARSSEVEFCPPALTQ